MESVASPLSWLTVLVAVSVLSGDQPAVLTMTTSSLLFVLNKLTPF